MASQMVRNKLVNLLKHSLQVFYRTPLNLVHERWSYETINLHSFMCDHRTESKKEEPPPSRKGKKERLEGVRPTTSRKPSPRRSRRGSNEGGKSSPPPATPASEADQSSTVGETTEFKTLKLSHFRCGQVKLWPGSVDTLLTLSFVLFHGVEMASKKCFTCHFRKNING